MGVTTWTEEADQIARSLWATRTASEIAAELARCGFYVSRNSVIGRLHRMGIDAKSKVKVSPSARRDVAPRPIVKPAVPVGSTAYKGPETRPVPFVCKEVPNVAPRHVSLLDLGADDCRWPFGDSPSEMTFCGLQKLSCKSYCQAHFNLSRGPGTPSERAAHRVAA